MQLERLRIALRPRSPWAAIDLGFAMARRWWRMLFLSWLLIAAPVFAIASVVSFKILWLVPVLLWWLKPLFEQLPLYILSRVVFGETPTWSEVRHQAKAWCTRDMPAKLTWRRLDPSRSFNAPVVQLEGLMGKQRRTRLQVLRDGHGGSSWLTLIGAHFEGVFYLSFTILAAYFFPEKFGVREWLADHGAIEMFARNLAYFMAISIIGPFYVAAGFSLYLHRRTQLEGWDIELQFRRLNARLAPRPAPLGRVRPALLAALLCVSCAAWAPHKSWAASAPAPVSRIEAKNLVNEVMVDPAFGEKVKYAQWRWKFDKEPKKAPKEPDNLWIQWLAQIGEMLMWGMALALIVYVVYRFPQWWARRRNSAVAAAGQAAPPTLFGLDVRAESLPADVPAEAARLCARGDTRAALSLLYRASLAVFMQGRGVPFEASFTEGECVAQVRHAQQGARAEFFAQLTRVWQDMAYAHVAPSTPALRALCDAWQRHFGAPP